MCFLASEYAVLDKDGFCNEQNIINDENECLLAARSTGNNYVGAEVNVTRPRGCYGIDNGTVRFNKQPALTPENSEPICLKG